MHEKELLQLVDRNDQEIGTFNRSQLETLMYKTLKRYLRTSCAFLQDSAGRLWVPRRVATKAIAPNGLDFAVAEHIRPSESYLDAMIRGFSEELNLTISADALTLIGILGPRIELRLPYFSAIYMYGSDTKPSYNRKGYAESYWLTPQEVTAQIMNGEEAKSLLLPALKLLLLQEG